MKAGEIKQPKPIDPISSDDEPFQLPKDGHGRALDRPLPAHHRQDRPQMARRQLCGRRKAPLITGGCRDYEVRKLVDLKYAEAAFAISAPRSMSRRATS